MGTNGGEESSKRNASDTMISLETDGDTSSISGLHLPPFDTTQGEESLRGNG
jgi:hypothetical protein